MIEVPLRRHDGSIRAYALIDDADAHLAEQRWCYSTGYAIQGHTGVLLHRAILGLQPGDGLQTDHINGDRLDCRRVNLRIVTHAQNGQNVSAHRGSTSRYRGVCWSKHARRWRATVVVDGRQESLGYFDDEDVAAAAAAEFRIKHLPFTNEARLAA